MQLKYKNVEQLDFFKTLGIEADKLENQAKVNVITTKEVEEIILSYKQLVVILEALYNFKIHIEKLDGEHDVRMRHEYKSNEISEIFEYIQNGMKYNFEDAVNKCHNKRVKQSNKDDEPGLQTFSWLGENKKS